MRAVDWERIMEKFDVIEQRIQRAQRVKIVEEAIIGILLGVIFWLVVTR